MAVIKATGLLLLLLMLVAGKVQAQSRCNATYRESNGTITADPTAVALQDCVYTISRNDTFNTNTVLKINSVVLGNNDQVVIYDGSKADNRSIVSYTSQGAVSDQVAIGFTNTTTIVFTPSVNQTKSSFSIEYSFSDCTVDLQNSYALKVDGPLYAPLQGQSLDCTYTVKNNLPADREAVATILNLDLEDSGTVTLSSSDSNHTYNSNSSSDDFYGKVDQPLNIQLNITNTRTFQTFSVLLEPVVADCSGSFLVNGSLLVNLTFPDQPVNYVCRWQIMTHLASVVARVTELSLVAGTDRLTFVEGGSSLGSVLASVEDNVKDGDYLVASTGNLMTISLTLGGNSGPRSLTMELLDAAETSRLTDSGDLLARCEKEGPYVAYYQLVASEGHLVQVDSLSNLTGNATMTFYNGLQTSDPVWAVLKSDAQDLRTVIGGSQMLVVVDKLAEGETVNASFTSVPTGCDMLATEDSGQMTYREDNSTLTAEQTCTWTIAPLSAIGTIVVDVTLVNVGVNESMTIWSGLDGKNVLAQVNGTEVAEAVKIPQLYVSAKDKMRVDITRGTTFRAETAVSLQYRVIPQTCGGQLDQPLTSLSTPNFPNQYPLNAQCVWAVDTSTIAPKMVYISFKSLSMAEGHSLEVRNDSSTTKSVVASYGGVSVGPNELPADLIVPYTNDSTTIQFVSAPQLSQPVSSQVSGGASWDTRLLTCGGNVTMSEGDIKTPGYPEQPTSSVYCLWILDVTAKSPAVEHGTVLNFSLTSGAWSDVSKYLKIYDGDSVRNAQLQTNASDIGKYRLSTQSRMVVIFDYNNESSTNNNVSFALNFKTFKCQDICDNGKCMHPDWRCNGINNCGDNTDEVNCTVVPTPIPPHPTPTPQEPDYSGYVKSGWVAGCLFIGILLGAGLLFIVPRIVRRLRSRGDSYSRMSDDRAVVT